MANGCRVDVGFAYKIITPVLMTIGMSKKPSEKRAPDRPGIIPPMGADVEDAVNGVLGTPPPPDEKPLTKYRKALDLRIEKLKTRLAGRKR